jgi:hypothetical protein
MACLLVLKLCHVFRMFIYINCLTPPNVCHIVRGKFVCMSDSKYVMEGNLSFEIFGISYLYKYFHAIDIIDIGFVIHKQVPFIH